VYILDNNILNILFYPHPARHLVESKIREKGKHNVWLSAIAVYEKLINGVLPTFKKTLNTKDEVLGFQTLQYHVEKLATFQILPFTAQDYEHFKDIYNAVKKAPMDCRYAASAKSREWIVVTHDQKDFSVIKDRCGVDYEDWSVAPFK
jgi:predicted nucleic acid-binding protein